MINIIHAKNEAGGAFLVLSGEKNMGEMCYSLQDKVMSIVHTEIDAELRGQHIGEQLVDKGVALAREHGYSIVPVCRFTKAVFEKDPEAVADVWKKQPEN